MNELLAQRSRHIIPFRFGDAERSKRDYIMFLDRKTDRYHGRWVEDSVVEGEQDLFSYVLNSFDDRGRFLPGNIGASFRYLIEDGDGDDSTNLVQRLRYFGGEKSDNRVFDFDITNAGLMLFVTGVGFFWYDIGELTAEDGNDVSIEDEILFTSRFKELNHRENLKRFFRKDDERPYSTGDWVAEIVTGACPGAVFFDRRKNILKKKEDDRPESVPDKALLYQYAAFDEEAVTRQRIIDTMYYRTKGYNKNYRIPDDFESQIMSPFGNVRWYASKEGVSYFAWHKHSAEGFFAKEMPRRYMKDYFILYMLAINEQYTMLSFAERMAEELPADPQAYLTDDLYLDITGNEERNGTELLDLERTVARLSTEINVFFAKNVRSSVSFVDHQDRFYLYVIKMLRVREDTEQIMQGLKALQMLLQDVVRQEMDYSDRNKTQIWRRERAYQKLEKEKDLLRKELFNDAVTGLYNRNGLKYYGRQLYTEAREQGKCLFVCVADMNGLKYINDNFGHEEGDAALKGIADILKKCALEGDYTFRQGGDEFLVMGLRDQGSNEEAEFAERAEKAMKEYNDDLKDERYRVAMSYGPLVVDMRDSQDDLDNLMKISDERMYEMKMKKDEYKRD
ncbi:MAG: GGDEF domain-containing protein [Lachnospiraceae bacterium]|nr:GGDEF domain-containing protein [Lachnospiraceae bacterium]